MLPHHDQRVGQQVKRHRQPAPLHAHHELVPFQLRPLLVEDVHLSSLNEAPERLVNLSICIYSPGIRVYSEIIPIVASHVSTNSGHRDTGSFVRRSPNAWPPCAYKCISTGTPAFFNAM